MTGVKGQVWINTHRSNGLCALCRNRISREKYWCRGCVASVMAVFGDVIAKWRGIIRG